MSDWAPGAVIQLNVQSPEHGGGFPAWVLFIIGQLSFSTYDIPAVAVARAPGVAVQPDDSSPGHGGRLSADAPLQLPQAGWPHQG